VEPVDPLDPEPPGACCGSCLIPIQTGVSPHCIPPNLHLEFSGVERYPVGVGFTSQTVGGQVISVAINSIEVGLVAVLLPPVGVFRGLPRRSSHCFCGIENTQRAGWPEDERCRRRSGLVWGWVFELGIHGVRISQLGMCRMTDECLFPTAINIRGQVWVA